MATLAERRRAMQKQQETTIYTPPGEWHWHGAAPDHFMSHLAMWETTGAIDGSETTWGELVSEEEYGYPG